MHTAHEAEAAEEAARLGASAGAAEAARAEFRGMFVSLVDPAGLLRMDRCAEIAGRMGDVASRAGYGAGTRMAAALAGIFADTDSIVGRQVDDTTLHSTHLAFRNMMGVLYDTARAYRDGESPEPVASLEEAREAAARLRAKVDAHMEDIGRPGSPGPALTGSDVQYRGMVCRNIVRKYQEGVREEIKARGRDPIFPPKPRPIDEFFGEYGDPNLSSADMIALSSGDIPDGYKLVRIEDESSGGGEKPRAHLDGGTLVARGRGAADIHHDGAAEAARAEFRGMFVSLVDPAGLLYMDRCAVIAGRMGDAASRAGYGAGARMAAALAGIFADTGRIVDRPVDDGGLYYTHSAFENMMGVLYDTARAYRGGESPEPVARLEEAREAAARLRARADEYREELRRADPPGSGLDGLSTFYLGRMCRDVVRKDQISVREEIKARGYDPVFPPKPKPVSECFGVYDDPKISSADMIALSRGDIPDGYELVRIEDGAQQRG